MGKDESGRERPVILEYIWKTAGKFKRKQAYPCHVQW